MKRNNSKAITSAGIIIIILLLVPVTAFANAVPWTSETYTAFACASNDHLPGPPNPDASCYGSYETYSYGPPLPISAIISFTEETAHPTRGSANITSSDMSVYAHSHHSDQLAASSAEFSGTFIAIDAPFLFTYELALNANELNDAWLTVTDQTSGSILADYTLQVTSNPTLISVGTPDNHVISVDFGVETAGFLGSSTLNYATAIAPEPISSILFVTGGTLLVGRRFLKKKKTA